MTVLKNAPLLLNHTAELLAEWFRLKTPAERIKQIYFHKRKYLGSKDRSFIELLFYDIIRNLRLYDWQIRNNAPDEKELSADLYVVHAFKRLFPEEAKQIAFKINDNISSYIEKYVFRENIPDHPALRWSLPEFVWDKIRSAYPNAELLNCLKDLHEQRGLHIRANTLKTTARDLVKALKEYSLRPGNMAPDALRSDKYIQLSGHPLYRKGFFEFQDESSQLVGYVCNPKEHDLAIDLCAGAGGKTLHLAALQKDKGRIIASDLYAERLKELKVRAARAGINSLALTGLRNIQNTFRAKADILLIDAPCSGSGVYGRQPDRKWIFTPEKLDHYVGLQRDLLDKHACLVKTDGYLVYATCSIIPDENEKQVEYFLSNHPEFMLVPVTNDLKAFGIQFPSDAINTMLTILPHYFKSDGFFIAKMKRIP